jgi:hypothetical protein
MKLSELHEAQDYHKITDPALRWLAQYTYENLDKWPGVHIMQELLTTYPCEAGTIYRGINFATAEKYAQFMQLFGGKTTTTLTFNGVTSWSKHEKTAQQFAITQPTYFLNREVMVAHDQMNRQRERLTGYRGVILSMKVEQGGGIDVDASGVGHESEVIMPPGTHEVTIHEHIKTYADQIQDQDVTPDQVIQAVHTADELYKSGASGHSFVSHVLHHHVHTLSDASRQHVFGLLKPAPGVPSFEYEVEPTYEWGKPLSDKVDVSYHIPALRLFLMYDKHMFTRAAHVTAIKREAGKVIKQVIPMLDTYLVRAHRLDMHMIRLVAQIAGMESELDQVIRRTVGAEYHRLQQVGREINQIPDVQARARAIQDHTQALTDLLRKIK